MPEKVHDCVNQIKGEHGEDSAWAICNSSVKECSICGEGEHEPNDHPFIPTVESSVLAIAGISESTNPLGIPGLQEHHNPLDIPFGHEVHELNMEVKSDEVDEGGLGSGRNPEGGDSKGGSQQGPLISFGETINQIIVKDLMDAKLKESCSCHKKN